MAKPVTKRECLYLLCDRRRYKESYYCLHHNGQYVKYGVEGMSSIKGRGRTNCNYINCDGKSEYGLLCRKHHKVVNRNNPRFRCKIIDCGEVVITKGLCHKHEVATRRYGIDHKTLSNMIGESTGICKICNQKPGQKGLHIDHDRKCCDKIGSCGSCVRDLICYRCNVALAHINEDYALMKKALEYLTRDYSILHIKDERHVDPSTTSWDHRWRKYQVGLNRYRYLEESHDGKCAICQKEWGEMHIDHDHQTGKIRGALCRECNLYLGDVKDSNDTILSMIQYVKRHKMEMVR